MIRDPVKISHYKYNEKPLGHILAAGKDALMINSSCSNCPRQHGFPPCCQLPSSPQPPQIPPEAIILAEKSMTYGVLGLFLFHLVFGIMALSYANRQKDFLGYLLPQAKSGRIMGIVALCLVPLDLLIFAL